MITVDTPARVVDECVIVYVNSNSDTRDHKPTQTVSTQTTDTSAYNGASTKDASTQTTNIYFCLQAYDEGGEMKLALNTAPSLNDSFFEQT